MNSFNLGAVLIALLVGVWLLYAVPKTADRRYTLGEAERIAQQRHSESARDVTDACRTYSSISHEVTDMPENRSLLRPADPTSRPRFGVEKRTDLEHDRPHHSGLNTALTVLLSILVGVTLVTVVTTSLSLTSIWFPLGAVAALGLCLVARQATRLMHTRNASDDASVSDDEARIERAPEVEQESDGEASHAEIGQASDSEVSRPSDMSPAERHEAFLRQVLEAREAGTGKALADERFASRVSFRYGSLSTGSSLEAADVEEREADAERGTYLASDAQVIGSGLTVDDVMRRRRA
ncbi:hypothetical protein HMPREF1484_01437 [Dermabacter sp. HFH0086]|uniref:hypothetical protein n=1 Tax=Dermabacter TaxID=36739 RepID=UPI0003545FA7|nr:MULTISPECIES: hypothetical protein [Dermabacter]EPH15800.1 hypothetical protein HMPREF1484_01437 [Dermabacter sp. HFH0086]